MGSPQQISIYAPAGRRWPAPHIAPTTRPRAFAWCFAPSLAPFGTWVKRVRRLRGIVHCLTARLLKGVLPRPRSVPTLRSHAEANADFVEQGVPGRPAIRGCGQCRGMGVALGIWDMPGQHAQEANDVSAHLALVRPRVCFRKFVDSGKCHSTLPRPNERQGKGRWDEKNALTGNQPYPARHHPVSARHGRDSCGVQVPSI